MNTSFSRSLRIGLILLVLAVTALACGPSLTVSKEATLTPEPESTRIEPTAVPTETPVEEATLAPTLTEEVMPTATATSVAEVLESWRIEPFPGATLIATDKTQNLDQAFLAAMDQQVRNLAIPQPYYFEFYVLPQGTTSLDVREHYNKLLTAAGMKKAFDEEGIGGITLTTWLHTSVKGRKYAVQFNPADASRGQEYPISFIIYSKPPAE